MFRRSCPALMVALLWLVSGCGDSGPATYPVQGKVAHQKKPLEFGTVMFLSDGGAMATASIQPDGTYQTELLPGNHKVCVLANPPRQGRPDPDAEGGLDTTGFPEPKPIIPQKYARHESSGIAIEVKSDGENLIDIELP